MASREGRKEGWIDRRKIDKWKEGRKEGRKEEIMRERNN